MTTFAKLKLGDKFICQPENDRKPEPYNVFMKTIKSNEKNGFQNAVNIQNGIFSSMPNSMLVVPLTL